jgi:hypothetical protein
MLDRYLLMAVGPGTALSLLQGEERPNIQVLKRHWTNAANFKDEEKF